MSAQFAKRDEPITPFAIGRRVLGPVLAEFMLRLWAFGASVPDRQNAKLLFCARGGLRLRLLFDDVLARAGLGAPLAYDDLMVSRLIAVRPALLRRQEAALDELRREFADATLGDAALALAQRPIALGPEWSAPFSKAAFAERLWSGDEAARAVLDAIETQHALFERHFDRRRGDASHVILCDTGLNGSTLKLLSLGMPEVDLSCVLFARSNYKGLDNAHFSRTAGLSIQHDSYSIFHLRSTVFRYWQLIEDVLEPSLPSVKTFELAEGLEEPRSNLEIPNWQNEVLPKPGQMFEGVRAYVLGLPTADFAAQVYRDTPAAWSELSRLIARPRPHELDALLIGDRSRDFGRADKVPTLEVTGRGLRASVKDLQASLWKEGRIVHAHPKLRGVMLLGIEGAYLLRTMRRRLGPKLDHFRLGQLNRGGAS